MNDSLKLSNILIVDYNLDVIIAVGFRVNSNKAAKFRIWVTKVLKEFITKGFVLDDERLKQGKQFGKEYIDEVLERKKFFPDNSDFFLFLSYIKSEMIKTMYIKLLYN
ncbi:MAG: virulence RhuM family protein [Prolixibacteraceae bacterium]|nr:virulence RhuM family protein [Prolixibacteraceae bacterium]